MEFQEARGFMVPFGKHKGRSIDEVARTDEGLWYLDWMVGLDDLFGGIREALEAYLSDPSIRKELERVLDEGGERS